MAQARAKKFFLGALVGVLILSAEPAVTQTVDPASQAPNQPASRFGNLDQPAATAEPLPTFEDAEPAAPARVTIQNGYIGGSAPSPAAAPPDVIVAAIENGDRLALFRRLESDCQAGCGDRLDASDALQAAAVHGDTAVIDILIAKGGNVNDRAAVSGWTPLMVALYSLNTDMARHLLAAGADPAVMGNDGTTAPFLARLAGLGDLIPYPKLNIAPEVADMLLLRAIEVGSMPYVELAIASGARASATAENGWSALMIASFRGEVGAVERLIAADRSIISYAEPRSGLTAVHAVLVGLVDPRDRMKLEQILRKLGAAGADLSQPTKAGVSPLEITKNQKLGAKVEVLVTALLEGVQPPNVSMPETPTAQQESEKPLDETEANEYGYLKQNLNLRSGPSTERAIVQVMQTGDRIEVLDYLSDGWVKVMSPTGATGFIRKSYLSDTRGPPPEFGAVCMDTLRGFNYLYEVAGRPSSVKAKDDVLAFFTKKSNCNLFWEFSGEECYAIAYTGNDLTVTNNFVVAIETGQDEAQSKAISDCTTQYGASCQGIKVICATQKRK